MAARVCVLRQFLSNRLGVVSEFLAMNGHHRMFKQKKENRPNRDGE